MKLNSPFSKTTIGLLLIFSLYGCANNSEEEQIKEDRDAAEQKSNKGIGDAFNIKVRDRTYTLEKENITETWEETPFDLSTNNVFDFIGMEITHKRRESYLYGIAPFSDYTDRVDEIRSIGCKIIGNVKKETVDKGYPLPEEAKYFADICP